MLLHNLYRIELNRFLFFSFLLSIGLNEDSVTGSALCALAPYYNHKFFSSTSSSNNLDDDSETIPMLNSYQASQRGGSAKVGVIGDRVAIVGHCKTIMHSTFNV